MQTASKTAWGIFLLDRGYFLTLGGIFQIQSLHPSPWSGGGIETPVLPKQLKFYFPYQKTRLAKTFTRAEPLHHPSGIARQNGARGVDPSATPLSLQLSPF